MKVVAIDSSPEKGHGRTAILLNPFLEGMKADGAHVDLYFSSELQIFPCCGNLNCTVKTPGKCMARDDMMWLRHEIGQADVLVLASPLYFNGITGTAGATESTKRLLERLVPGVPVSPEAPYEHAIHTTREQVNLRKVIVLSGCGFWEIDDFYPVLTHLKAFCHNTFPELAGCITGPRSATVRGVLPEGASEDDIRKIASEAGRQMAGEYEQSVKKQQSGVMNGDTVIRTNEKREWHSVILFQFQTM